MTNEIDKCVNKIIETATKELQEQLTSTELELTSCKLANIELKNENKKIKLSLAKVDLILELNSLITKENFDNMLPLFNLKMSKFSINGSHSDELPTWFRCLYLYYEERDKLFNIMDIFQVEYPTWAKSFKLPSEYSEEELELFLDRIRDHYVCNSCIYDGNVGFFWERVKEMCGDTNRILTYGNYTEIPWQLVLSNPLWLNDNLFEKMLTVIKQGKSNSHYFFKITDYLQLSEEQVWRMFYLLPQDPAGEYLKFVENNIKILKCTEPFGQKFKDKINDNHYSVFKFTNYPLEMQKEYIRKSVHQFTNIVQYIERMPITKEEKIKFTMEFIK